MPESLFKTDSDNIYHTSTEVPAPPLPTEIDRVITDEVWHNWIEIYKDRSNNPGIDSILQLATSLKLLHPERVKDFSDSVNDPQTYTLITSILDKQIQQGLDLVNPQGQVQKLITALGEIITLNPNAKSYITISSQSKERIKTVQANLVRLNAVHRLAENSVSLLLFDEGLWREVGCDRYDWSTLTDSGTLNQRASSASARRTSIDILASLRILFPHTSRSELIETETINGCLSDLKEGCSQPRQTLTSVSEIAKYAANLKIVTSERIIRTEQGLTILDKHESGPASSAERLPDQRKY